MNYVLTTQRFAQFPQIVDYRVFLNSRFCLLGFIQTNTDHGQHVLPGYAGSSLLPVGVTEQCLWFGKILNFSPRKQGSYSVTAGQGDECRLQQNHAKFT